MSSKRFKAARRGPQNNKAPKEDTSRSGLEKFLYHVQEQMARKNQSVRYRGILNGITYVLAGWITAVILQINGIGKAMYAVPGSFVIGLLGYLLKAAVRRSKEPLLGIWYFEGSWICAQAVVIAGAIMLLGV